MYGFIIVFRPLLFLNNWVAKLNLNLFIPKKYPFILINLLKIMYKNV